MLKRVFRRFNRAVNTYFGFSTKEMNGVYVLLLVIVIAIITPLLYERYLLSITKPNKDDELLKQWMSNIDEESQPVAKNNVEKLVKKKLVSFDPNTASLQTLIDAGIPPKIASRLINYRSKGGFFKTKEDIKKIYGISDKIYLKIVGTLYIEPKKQVNDKINSSKEEVTINKTNKFQTRTIEKSDLNQMDTAQLNKLKGIGCVLSARIVKYREALGGFITIAQIGEVYGINQETLDEVNKLVFIKDNFMPQKININTSSFEDLKKHPYIKSKLAQILLNYKKQHGDYKSIEDLKNIKIISEETYLKLLPYLQF